MSPRVAVTVHECGSNSSEYGATSEKSDRQHVAMAVNLAPAPTCGYDSGSECDSRLIVPMMESGSTAIVRDCSGGGGECSSMSTAAGVTVCQ